MPQSGATRRGWLYPILFLSSMSVGAFVLMYWLDRRVYHSGGALSFFQFEPDKITDAMASLSSLIAAVLGIVITVVSIVVQLSASRYAHVTGMFFRDRVNKAVMAFYIVGCVCGILVSFSVGQTFVPRISLISMLVVAILGFALMAPYFAYVFDFLQPQNIIARIRMNSRRAAQRGAKCKDEVKAKLWQDTAIIGVEQLTDMTVHSISGKDKIIATAGVDALKDLAVGYLTVKQKAKEPWFHLSGALIANPDFVSLSAESVGDLENSRTWLEWKVLRQYQAIYGEALGSMQDINYVIALDTRYIGEAAIKHDEKEVLALCVKFFNSYLRRTLNAKSVRTAYNILNQYRELAQAIVKAGWDEKAVEVADYIKYYGHVSFGMSLAFVTETVAYDLCALCEFAHEANPGVEEQLVRVFLEVDQPAIDGESQETSLRGVRKAQVKLATYYLVAGEEHLARVIFQDMKQERPERLRSIREELERVESKDFWEVIDRGTNFDYLPPERKAVLSTFFSWFEASSDEPSRRGSTRAKEAQS